MQRSTLYANRPLWVSVTVLAVLFNGDYNGMSILFNGCFVKAFSVPPAVSSHSSAAAAAAATTHRNPFDIETRLYGKGFNSAKNKQASLAEKMNLAKKQQKGQEEEKGGGTEQHQGDDTSSSSSSSGSRSIDPPVAHRDKASKNNDDDAHAEFAKLLANSKPPPRTNKDDSAAVSMPKYNKSQQPKLNLVPKIKPTSTKAYKRKKKAARADRKDAESSAEDVVVVLHLGDKARRRDFEGLVDVSTGQPMGPVRAAQLVPWVPPFVTDALVVVADRRRQSADLRLSVEYLQSTFISSEDHTVMNANFVAITADESAKETLAWMTRANIDKSKFGIFQDSSSLDWMATYGCVGDEDGSPWSMHVLIIDNDGIIQVNECGVDTSKVCQLVAGAIASLSNK